MSSRTTVGKATGDERTGAEGKTDSAKGEAKDTAHDVKECAKGVRDSLEKDRTHTPRTNIRAPTAAHVGIAVGGVCR